MNGKARELVIATTNQHKFSEIEKALAPTQLRLRSLRDFPEAGEASEPGRSFGEIARQKAMYYYDRIKLPVLAEDSGLVIPALNGYPGVRSARIGSDDRERIREVLARVAHLKRITGILHIAAYYICSINCIVNGKEITSEGRCDGILADEPHGHSGFGYDPIFIPEGFDKTFGMMRGDEKLTLSHRGRALSQILQPLQDHLQS